MPSTLMGQFMEALNNQTNSDDLNIDDFQGGGLECDVDEVIYRFRIFIRIFLSSSSSSLSDTSKLI